MRPMLELVLLNGLAANSRGGGAHSCALRFLYQLAHLAQRPAAAQPALAPLSGGGPCSFSLRSTSRASALSRTRLEARSGLRFAARGVSAPITRSTKQRPRKQKKASVCHNDIRH